MGQELMPVNVQRAGIGHELANELGQQFATWVEVRRRSSAQPLEQLGRQYLAWLRIRRSPKTVETYAVAIELFAEFAFDNKLSTPAEVDHRHVEAFMAKLIAEGVSARTVNNRLATLRGFWKWMRRVGVTISNVPADCV